MFGKIPIGAIGMISNIVTLIHGLGDKIVNSIALVWDKALSGSEYRDKLISGLQDLPNMAENIGENVAKGF